MPGHPYTCIEQEVAFTNSGDGARLVGTLTVPEIDSTYPAVVLISGSGLQDRDETAYGHKPFKVLAEYLSGRGIAVLRYDDRGAGGSTGPMHGITPEDFAADALAGLRYLKSRDDLKIGGIGLIGHSMGAVEGSILAGRNPDIAFLVMLGGPGMPLDWNMLKSDSASNVRLGKSVDAVNSGQTLLRSMIAAVKGADSGRVTEADLERVIGRWRDSLPPQVKEGIDAFTKSRPDHWRAMASEWATPYFYYVLHFDPCPVISEISCPVLSLIGEKDVQTLPEENSRAIRSALENGKCGSYRVEIVPNVNHLFQECETGTIGEYARIEGTFSKALMESIARWIF